MALMGELGYSRSDFPKKVERDTCADAFCRGPVV